MGADLIIPSFSVGELSPGLFGRVDLQAFHRGAGTMRNMFVNYKGGASSRAGTAFVGRCKQAGSAAPPKDIPFRYSLDENYVLEFGDYYMRVKYHGAYVLEGSFNITAATSANPCVLTIPGHDFSPGDWFYVNNVGGMTQLNQRTFIVQSISGDDVIFQNILGNLVDSLTYTAYTSGGTAAKIFTLTTPYVATDLPALKYDQQPNVMTLTHRSYAPRELTRVAADNWVLSTITFASSISAPTGLSVTASSTTTSFPTGYSYVVTAIDDATVDESIASTSDGVTNSVNINAILGSLALSWTGVSGAGSYNIYKAPVAVDGTVPSGSLFGYIGTVTGTSFTDSNIISDYSITPPLHYNPFPGADDYPGVVSFFQQRRVFANTNNNPDTYWMTKPGSYSNMDYSQISQDTDSVTGSPWSRQINGIQFMVPMPGGLVILTGLGAWQLSGTGGTGSPVTPADQNAQPQASNGCHQLLQPIVINYDILYVQSKGSIVRDLAYNIWINIYAGSDISVLSSHLFANWQLSSWTWAEEPYKIVWCVRNDGTLLSLTYLKEQEVQGWSRHDTNGQFVSVCAVSEPPVDAVYLIIKRYVDGGWYYYSERMDDRLWNTIEDCWCVDCGLKHTQPAPAANITASSATGLGSISSVNVVLGGSGFTTIALAVQDPTGSGAELSATVVAGVVTTISVDVPGAGYTAPELIISGTGVGLAVAFNISNEITVQADASVFAPSDEGSIIRLGGGMGEVVSYVSPSNVTVNLTSPITNVILNDPNSVPLPIAAGDWTLTVPITQLTNLEHLEGKTITFLADGSVVSDVVVVDGTVTLPHEATSIVGGLPFTAQLQSLYVDTPGESTIQGKRKNIYQAGVRVELSRGIKVGSNQVDASTQQNQVAVPWTGLTEVRDRGNMVNAGLAIPLYTGTYIQNIKPGFSKHGQVACEQDYPLPMNILAFIPDVDVGDTNG